MSIDRPTPTADIAESRGTEVERPQRRRLEHLDRMLRRTGFVRSHEVYLNDRGEIAGHIKAPRRLLSQSLAPVLKARDLGYRLLDHPGEPTGAESVVTVRIHERGLPSH